MTSPTLNGGSPTLAKFMNCFIKNFFKLLKCIPKAQMNVPNPIHGKFSTEIAQFSNLLLASHTLCCEKHAVCRHFILLHI
jgi:hypothetical protein